MTLTELRYIVALAQERHFGKAALQCHVSQPTLSVAIKKLEDELEVKLFERNVNEVNVTPLGQSIVNQAQVVLEEAAKIKAVAQQGKDPLAGPMRLGVIYTIAPYLLPKLVRQVIARAPQMPLVLLENFTVRLLDMLRTGEIDCAIIAEPFPDAGLAVAPLYDEPFLAALPAKHPLAKRAQITTQELKDDALLLLGAGHCFRDHVLEVCPEYGQFVMPSEGAPRGVKHSFEGSSLETIKHMVAAGIGVTLMPALGAVEAFDPPGSHDSGKAAEKLLAYVPIAAARKNQATPSRRVVLVWRRSFTRYEAIAALRNAVMACELVGVKKVNSQ